MERFSIRNDGIDFRMDAQFTAQQLMEQIREQATNILAVLMTSQDFPQTFLCTDACDLHLFAHTSKRLITLDVLTRCSPDQVANFDTYKFTAHPMFEKKIATYTRCSEKPNVPLSKCRAWDVALSVILKVEALDKETAMQSNSRLLFREYTIMKYIWESYLRENMELDEMTGIPMVFKYTEVPNTEFNNELNIEYKVVDIFGSLIPWKSDNLTTLSYMSMEKLGPNVKYLQELMIVTKRRSRTFDLDTSFKIYDQLICRCLQIHRFGVVHNSLEPRNVYFGRSMAFNVVYLSNFSKSMILDSKERKVAETFLGGDPRYLSHLRIRGSSAYPIQDIESVFYMLLSMIVSTLPWDIYLQKQGESTPRVSENFVSTAISFNQSNTSALPEDVEPHPKVREMKSNFWSSPNGINRVFADMRFLTVGEEPSNVGLAIEIIKELYGKLRDNLQKDQSKRRREINLMTPQSPEFQFYLDLRRTVLLFFRFENLSALLLTPTYQKKIETYTKDEQQPRPAWNITNWCFNAVQMNAPGNQRLSMLPVDAVVRSAR